MMKWGDPNESYIKQQVSRQRREDVLRESQIEMNRKSTASLDRSSDKHNKTVVHNHFNIIINVAPNTTEDKITSIVEKLTAVIYRVN